MSKASTLTRIRRHNGRELLEAARTLVTEGLRMYVARRSEPRRDRLRRALCCIAERLALSDVDVEPMIAEVRCGHHRGAWVRELGLRTSGSVGLSDEPAPVEVPQQ
jgi:hypothetical protein